jgi:hypothetical protein
MNLNTPYFRVYVHSISKNIVFSTPIDNREQLPLVTIPHPSAYSPLPYLLLKRPWKVWGSECSAAEWSGVRQHQSECENVIQEEVGKW